MDKVVERIETRLASLTAEASIKAWKFVAVAADQGIPVRVVSTRRSYQEQHALYAQGRQPQIEVNTLREMAGMDPINLVENSHTVTNAPPGTSNHETGNAFDVVPMSRMLRLLPDWASGHWAKLGEIGRSLGLEWGGDWDHQDKPHFQLKV